MADTTPETKEERQARWWRDWWAADYSWDGLAKKEILGGGQWGEKTLQDYWRRDPETGEARTDEAMKAVGELVEHGGQWWHLAHLPTMGGRESGAYSWKNNLDAPDWVRLATIITDRLAVAKETPGTLNLSPPTGALCHQPLGADKRARLDGMISFGPVSSRPQPEGKVEPINLVCDQAAFIGTLKHSNAVFGPGASFRLASFSGRSYFDGATFAGEAIFQGTAFSNDTRFVGVTFSMSGRFDQAAFFEDVSFENAVFSNGAGFCEAGFSGLALFRRATFAGDSAFESAAFSGGANFVGATFAGIAGFHGAGFFGYANFNSATISGDAYFGQAAFSGDAGFEGVIFSEGTRFDAAAFSRNALFCRARFSKDARFDAAVFSGSAVFDGSTFSGNARFDNARFERVATFSEDRSLGEPVENAVFKQDGSFRNAVFEHQVAFSAQVAQPEGGFAGAFYGTRFADIADFSRSGPPRPGTTDRNDGARMAVAFVEAFFEKTLILTDGSDQDAARAFRDGTMKVVREIPAGAAREELLDQLEAGCRTVKIAMGKARDEVREQRYYRFQLQARHARKDTHWSERFFGRLYGLASDYGGSLGRPLMLLAGLAVVSGLFYWLWAAGLDLGVKADVAAMRTRQSGLGLHDLFEAFSYAAARSLLANIWLAPQTDPQSWSAVFLNGHGAVWGFAVRLASALQSILSGVLIFLFALAVRRRFQIGG